MPTVARADIFTIPNAISVTRTGIAWLAILSLWCDIHLQKTQGALWWVGVFAAAIALDALDGWAARKLNSFSRIGSYIDILGDRLCEYPAWFLLSYANPATRSLVLVVVVRNVVVDGVKIVSSAKGLEMTKGVPNMSRFGEFVVNNPACKTLHNVLKTSAILAGLLSALYRHGVMSLLWPVLLTAHATFCVTRGLGSTLELRSILRAPRQPMDKGEVARYSFQWVVSLAALAVLLMI